MPFFPDPNEAATVPRGSLEGTGTRAYLHNMAANPGVARRYMASLGDQIGLITDIHEHVVTRSVRDTAAILDAVHGPMPGDPYVAPSPARPFLEEVGADPGRLRVGLMTSSAVGEVHPDCASAAESAGRLLESIGHTVEPGHPETMDNPEFTTHFITLWSVGAAWSLDYWSGKTGTSVGPDDVEPLTWALAEMGRSFSAPQLLAAQEWLQRWSRSVASWWSDGFDLLLTPTIAEPPPRLGEFDSSPDNPLQGLFRAAGLVPFTPPFNVTGQPAISLPLSWNDAGLPIGVQLVSAFGREDVLLRIADLAELRLGQRLAVDFAIR